MRTAAGCPGVFVFGDPFAHVVARDACFGRARLAESAESVVDHVLVIAVVHPQPAAFPLRVVVEDGGIEAWLTARPRVGPIYRPVERCAVRHLVGVRELGRRAECSRHRGPAVSLAVALGAEETVGLVIEVGRACVGEERHGEEVFGVDLRREHCRIISDQRSTVRLARIRCRNHLLAGRADLGVGPAVVLERPHFVDAAAR